MSNESIGLCRTCGKEGTSGNNIFLEGVLLGEVTSMASVLKFCTELDFIIEEDCLPDTICFNCSQSLIKAFKFKRMVIDTNINLRKLYSPSDNEIIISEYDENPTIMEEQGIEDLQELATAAQMKRVMENIGEYVTLTVVAEDLSETEQLNIDNDADDENQTITISHIDENIDENIEENIDENIDENIEESIEEGMEEENLEEGYEEELIVDEASDLQENLDDAFEVNISENIKQEFELTTDETADIMSEEDNGNTVCGDNPEEVEILDAVEVALNTYKARGKRKIKPPRPECQCKICGKQLSNLNSFKYHMQLHSDATPFLCSLCGEGFKTRNAYEGHILIHDPNNPNTCDICGKAYRQSSSLRIHMLAHTGERPYRCNICGKGITQKSGFKKHMLIHTGEKPHTCDVCGRHFRYSSNLIAHKRGHSGEKPYECSECDKTFQTSEQLKRHTIVHIGAKAFSCQQCGKSFKRANSLTVHKHLHTKSTSGKKIFKSNVVQLY